MPALQERVQVQVNSQAESQPRSPGQEPAGQVDGNALDRPPPELPQPEVEQAHECQGREEMLAELPVARPTPDRDRSRTTRCRSKPAGLVELDVERAAILERHPAKQRAALHFEGRERGVAVGAKAPLAGIRDELDPLGPQNLVRQLGIIRGFDRELFMADQQAGLERARRTDPLEMSRS